ncbi:flagellar filament capping protein FliD [Bacterioplanoides sp.]|uniref:flagellar filament capping protein FliD n=1 Tax=Bacterioplanoides sp. TaxID=2066072 RepID=UPI003B005680
MAAIESLGLGSGVLTNDLVDQIIGAEREASELRLDREETIVDAKITAYGEIQSLADRLKSAAGSLASPSEAGSTLASSSDESILTATGSVLADPGTYNIEVLNTAKSHSLVTGTYSSFNENIGTGEIRITFGEITYNSNGDFVSQEVNPQKGGDPITIDSSNQTLSGIRDAINNADIGARASIINDGTGFRLVVSSSDTGAENALRIETFDADGNLATTGLSALAYNENQNGAGNLEETARGEDAQLQVNGLAITRPSNSVEEVIDGVTLDLKSADVGKQVTVSVEPDSEGIQENIQAFVDAYNEFKQFSDELTSFDSDTEQAGLLLGDSTIRGIQQQIRSLISQPIAGLVGTQYRSLTELGVNTDRNNDFLLEFDTSVFNRALRNEAASVVSILSKSGSTSDSQITYVNDSINTQAGTYGVEITQLATQAEYQGGRVNTLDFSQPVIIDENNDGFTINVDGTNEAVTLTHGSYSSGNELASQIALQINSGRNIRNNFSAVTVNYNQSNRSFDITSNEFGSSSRVSFTSVDVNTANTLGFNVLGRGEYQGIPLTTINSDAFLGNGASTQPGSRALAQNEGINFAANNATFSLDVGSGAVAVTVNQNAAGNDLNNDGVIGDRDDTLQAIQTAIDATSLSGAVAATFDNNGNLIFQTTAVGDTQQIEITTVGSTITDSQLGLDATQGVQANGDDPGITFSDPVEFNLSVDGVTTSSKVSVAAGTYLNGDDLAGAIQTAIKNQLDVDPAFSSVTRGAETATATRDIATNIDFATANAGFTVNVSGVEKEIIVNSDSGDNVADIQTALDAAFGADVVIASQDGDGLKLTSFVATPPTTPPHQDFIQVTSDGRGAQTSAAAVINSGIDFSGANNATFTLAVAGIDINVDVNGDGTGGSNDQNSTLNVVQQALDRALISSGQFQAGDVVAKLDSSDQLFFETVSKEGTKTAATFGSSAQIEVKNLGGTAAATLGLTAETQSNGYDAFGLPDNRTYGYDVIPDVSYEFNPETNLGAFNINIGGNATNVSFSDLDTPAITVFGLLDADSFTPSVATGTDVAGRINGVEARGRGQFLTAENGNRDATNGFYIANPTADLSSGITIDSSNNKFTINVDGTEAEITLVNGAYNSGETLAAALQEAINDNDAFRSERISVKVEFNDDPASFAFQKLGIISASTGADSSVTLVDVPPGAAATFGFIPGRADGEQGADREGEIDPSSGIRLKVTGGALGARGDVTYITGFGDQLNDILIGILDGSNGTIRTRQDALDQEKLGITQDRERLDARLAAQEARLKSQFLFNDAIIQGLNTTGDFIKQQFDAITGANQRN